MRNEPGVLVTALIVLACVFGGGGVAYGLANLVVQLAAIILLALNGPATWQFVRHGPKSLALLAILTLSVPLLQLMPLPPVLWTAMPGRELLSESLQAVGSLGWHPTTVSTARTLVSFIGLLAPFTLLVLALRTSEDRLAKASLAFVAMGVVGVLLGAVQIVGNQDWAVPYPEPVNAGALLGFFANRNSTAIYFVCCLLLLCGRPIGRMLSVRWIATVAAAALLVVGVVLTQSRTGLVLLVLPLGLAVLRMGSAMAARNATGPGGGKVVRALLTTGLAAICIAVGIGAVVGSLPHSRFDTVLERFNKSEDQRPAIWEDARYSAQRYWPVGAGVGTFDEVFQIDESLENISQRRAGRAHNDYIEIAIEAGIAGFALIGLWTLWALWTTWTALGSSRRWEAVSGATILLAIALQSLVDYPLRNQTMLCLAAFAIALLANGARREKQARTREGGKA